MEYEEEKSNFKIFKVIKSMSTTRFSHYLLSNTFNDNTIKDLILIFYMGLPNTTIEGTVEKIQFNSIINF